MFSSVHRAAERESELLLSVKNENEAVARSDGDVGGGRRAGHRCRQAGLDSLACRNLKKSWSEASDNGESRFGSCLRPHSQETQPASEYGVDPSFVLTLEIFLLLLIHAGPLPILLLNVSPVNEA